MKFIQRAFSFQFLPLTLLIAGLPLLPAQTNNTLSKQERSSGWHLLFNGYSSAGWRGAYGPTFPKTGWLVENGELKGNLSGGGQSADAGDIVTIRTYRDFDLKFDWKLDTGGNSGVKYFVEDDLPKPWGSAIGYEYQMIDDANYIYEGKHLPQRLKTASIYDILAANKPDTTMNIWHTSRIRVYKNHITHWLDGKMVLDTDRSSSAFLEGLASGKFKNDHGFATIPSGHILLQDHGFPVAFRNIKIKELQ